MAERADRDADARWMDEALAEAAKGLGRTAPNPAVGCVLVKAGRAVARGYHRRAGLAHAEVEALRAAGGRAAGATAYVTLEPCCTQGRTPPCTEALLEAGVTRVVVGCKDPSPAVAGRGARALRGTGLEVTIGVRREECEELIRGFAMWAAEGRPWLQLKLAASLDGRIASRTGESKWISSEPSRRLVHEMRARADAVLVGIGTVLADDPRLTSRIRGATNPLRVVLDSQLRTPAHARVVTGRGRVLIIGAPRASSTRRRRLEDAGAEVLLVATRGRAGWGRLLRELGRRDVLELLVEGGAAVAAEIIRARVVNALTIFYNPRLIGSDGVPLVGELGVSSPGKAPRFETVDVRSVGSDLMWSGRPAR